MSPSEIASKLQAQISKSVYVEKDDDGQLHVATPFTFGDGDQPVIALMPNGDGWLLSDLGSTMFRLGFQLDDAMANPTNKHRLNSALSMAGLNLHNDVLTKPLQNGNYADALFDFIHALLKIDEMGDFGVVDSAARASGRGASRPQVRTKVNALVNAVLPPRRIISNWHDPEWDHSGLYPVDFKVNGMAKPLFLHALGSDNHTKDATVTIYRFNEKRVEGQHIAIFNHERSVSRNVKSRAEAVCHTSFGNVERQGDEIKEFLRQATAV